MYKNLFFAKSFWASKLGQAALASIVATSAMVIVTTQFGSDQGSDARPAPTGMFQVEIA